MELINFLSFPTNLLNFKFLSNMVPFIIWSMLFVHIIFVLFTRHVSNIRLKSTYNYLLIFLLLLLFQSETWHRVLGVRPGSEYRKSISLAICLLKFIYCSWASFGSAYTRKILRLIISWSWFSTLFYSSKILKVSLPCELPNRPQLLLFFLLMNERDQSNISHYTSIYTYNKVEV